MKKGQLIALIVLISFIIWVIIGRQIDQKELIRNGEIINAKIISWVTPSKGSTKGSLYCEFTYKAKRYKLFSTTSYDGGLHHLVGKTFPGVFSEKNEIVEILIMPNDF